MVTNISVEWPQFQTQLMYFTIVLFCSIYGFIVGWNVFLFLGIGNPEIAFFELHSKQINCIIGLGLSQWHFSNNINTNNFSGKNSMCIAQGYVGAVDGLLKDLKNKFVSFVRCIKPNLSSTPQTFEDEVVEDQGNFLYFSYFVQYDFITYVLQIIKKILIVCQIFSLGI